MAATQSAPTLSTTKHTHTTTTSSTVRLFPSAHDHTTPRHILPPPRIIGPGEEHRPPNTVLQARSHRTTSARPFSLLYSTFRGDALVPASPLVACSFAAPLVYCPALLSPTFLQCASSTAPEVSVARMRSGERALQHLTASMAVPTPTPTSTPTSTFTPIPTTITVPMPSSNPSHSTCGLIRLVAPSRP